MTSSRPVGQEGSEDGSTAVTSAPGVALKSDRDGPHVTTANAHPDLSVLAPGLAYITGGASGIGYGLAEESLAQGLAAVVIADVEPVAMEDAVERLQRESLGPGEVFGVVVDVSDPESVAASAEAVAERFPGMPISLLAANAGVGTSGSVIYSDPGEWEFVMGVNVSGVHNLLRTFVPGMLKQDGPGSIMATSSQDGICAANGIYGVSKHACTAIMEALHQEVRGRLSTHLLCPNVTATNVVTSERNRARISSSKSPAAPPAAAASSSTDGGDSKPNPILERFQVSE
jgi:NAD(P)-dependent dehydrogenase (short-subunit alcohol dehydrogenase family)